MRTDLSKLYAIYTRYNASAYILVVMVVAACISVFQTYNTIWLSDTITGPDPSKVMGWMLVDLVIFLAIVILAARKIFQKWLGRKHDNTGSRLQNRIMLMFCLASAVPTILVSVFSSYFFNSGIESWFDRKIQVILDQSVQVAESYITEHKTWLKDTAFSMADDVSNMYYDLVHNQVVFNKILDGQANMRSLHEVIVFQKSTNAVVARSSLSFSLAFISIPLYLVEKADHGEVVEIESDPSKIRMLIKLHDHDAYLLIGRLIDKNITNHIDHTRGAAQEYLKLKKLITTMQIKFSGIFILVAMIILLLVIICAIIFAAYVIMPIKSLVLATDAVKAGDLSVRVKEGPINDEIGILSSAFNRMVQQIERQQKDLIIAQRALAWSDVARRVAHEIKNPLTPIQLSAERLLKKFDQEVSDPAEFQKYVGTILRHTQDIGKIVAEFVNFAKMPSPTFERTDVIALLRNAVESHKIIHDNFVYSFASSIESLDIMCDITQMSQVMGNILKNAEEAIETAHDKVININITLDKEYLCVEVTDSGKGFPIDLMDRITEPYITTRSKGTGLGLAIVKKIVQDHHGTIEIRNTPGGSVKLTLNIAALNQRTA